KIVAPLITASDAADTLLNVNHYHFRFFCVVNKVESAGSRSGQAGGSLGFLEGGRGGPAPLKKTASLHLAQTGGGSASLCYRPVPVRSLMKKMFSTSE